MLKKSPLIYRGLHLLTRPVQVRLNVLLNHNKGTSQEEASTMSPFRAATPLGVTHTNPFD